MPDLTIQNANTLKEALRKRINLFLGAGFSVLAKNAAGKFLPAGNALRDDLVEVFRRPELKDLPLAKVCTIIEATRTDLLEGYLRKVFGVASFDPAYSIIPELNPAAIFTTNIDNLMPLVFKDSDKCYLNDIVKTGPAFANKTAVDYIPLHGSVVHAEGFTFNPVKIASAFSSDPDRWHFLTQRLQKSPTIFCGYGLEDAGVLEALNPITIAGREHQDKWLLVRDHNDSTEAYFSALGFNLIVGDTLALLNWLRDNAPMQEKVLATESITKHPALKNHFIPDPSSVPVRPIRDFYSGAPPTWDDIFSRRIFKTTHFRSVVEAILGKGHLIVLGMFASGKTTLMMQVAADIPFDGIKLVCSSITIENAELIVHALAGNRALVFLDDFAESVEVFNFFASQSNVQVIGFERTYSFDIISHLVSDTNLTIHECTELTGEDLQGLYQAIPKELRKDRLVVPPTAYGTPPSLFEVVETNMIAPRIMQRFAGVLRELEKKSELEHDLLAFCCYVHECRTPVSFDMALAFLKEEITDYKEVYELVEKLNSLVVSSYDLMVDTEEDYFLPRSAVISNAVLQNIRAASFRRVLEKFQNRVSRLRIVRFDIFRRHGFDESFATRAFPEWKDGLHYYETLVSKDPSPFLYQQAALYLAKKQQYREAFRWIDQAIEMSGSKIPSIRNSHAVILFRANIGAVDTGSEIVSDTLKRSMDILADCYRYDKRKNYHAIRFGEQALEYWKAYGDATAKGYLSTSQKWLAEEKRKSPWNRRIGQLLKEVSQTLTKAS